MKLRFKELSTDRLDLRSVTHIKLEDLHDLLSIDPGRANWAGFLTSKNLENTQDWVEQLAKDEKGRRKFVWGICPKPNRGCNLRLVGLVQCYGIESNWGEYSAAIGSLLYPLAQKKGYMTEAMEAVLDFCRERNIIPEVDVHEQNPCRQDMVRLAQRLGFGFQPDAQALHWLHGILVNPLEREKHPSLQDETLAI